MIADQPQWWNSPQWYAKPRNRPDHNHGPTMILTSSVPKWYP